MGRKESLSWEPKATENDACGRLAPSTELESINKFSQISTKGFTMSQGAFKVTNGPGTGVSPFSFLSEQMPRRWTPFLANGEDYTFNTVFGLVMDKMIW